MKIRGQKNNAGRTKGRGSKILPGFQDSDTQPIYVERHDRPKSRTRPDCGTGIQVAAERVKPKFIFPTTNTFFYNPLCPPTTNTIGSSESDQGSNIINTRPSLRTASKPLRGRDHAGRVVNWTYELRVNSTDANISRVGGGFHDLILVIGAKEYNGNGGKGEYRVVRFTLDGRFDPITWEKRIEGMRTVFTFFKKEFK